MQTWATFSVAKHGHASGRMTERETRSLAELGHAAEKIITDPAACCEEKNTRRPGKRRRQATMTRLFRARTDCFARREGNEEKRDEFANGATSFRQSVF